MDCITDVSVSPLTESSNFVNPFRMNYNQSGKMKSWDLVFQKPSVAIILFNESKRKLILVKQFRPAVYASFIKRTFATENLSTNKPVSGKEGITLELCAGIIDKPEKTPKKIAQLEALEECGYEIPLNDITHVMTFLSGVGIAGEYMHLFYAEVSNKMKVSDGGGLESEGEMIEVVEMSINEVESYLSSSNVKSPMFTIYGLNWFLSRNSTQNKHTLNVSNVVWALLAASLGYVINRLSSSSK